MLREFKKHDWQQMLAIPDDRIPQSPSSMAFTLETVVPWGRSFDEYRRMFALTDSELQQRIRGCADGCQVVIETVDYEFQRGANQMMRILCGGEDK